MRCKGYFDALVICLMQVHRLRAFRETEVSEQKFEAHILSVGIFTTRRESIVLQVFQLEQVCSWRKILFSSM